ncbi:hypothetical protein PAMC26577_08390 [Caballeronia sordidicola]|uniref:Uncharacterized protein n=1 Tax=Caballeronia sordidicola TaxID=196367 RepID=A0A242N292_CABSO|nr:hypothetical protein PAMC26577_08390 [Caballeronia sordidicola]
MLQFKFIDFSNEMGSFTKASTVDAFPIVFRPTIAALIDAFF